LTSGSVHVELLPWIIGLPSVFLLERRKTNRQTDGAKHSILRQWLYSQRVINTDGYFPTGVSYELNTLQNGHNSHMT